MLKLAFFFHFVFISLGATAQFNRTLDFNKVNPTAQTINGIDFPRTKEIKYRGTSEIQMDRFGVIEAMLGLNTPMESILMSGVKLMLMGKTVPFMKTIQGTISARDLETRVQEAIAKNKDQYYSETEARKLAFSIIESDLLARYKSQDFKNHFYNYLAPEYELFPQEVLFSTVFLEVANIYSRYIVLIDEKGKSDMLDLNFWNKVNNGDWTFTANEWVDKGEFVTPIAIEAKKLVGYFEYLSQVPDHRIYRALPNELDLAWFQTEVNGEKMVLVFDGFMSPVLRAKAMLKQNENKYTYADSRFEANAEIPQYLKSSGTSGNILAVIKFCPKTTSCSLSHPLLASAKRSDRLLDEEWENRIASITNGNKSAKIFYANGKIDAKSIKTGQFLEVLPAPKSLLSKLKEADADKFSKSSSNEKPVIGDKKLSWDLKSFKLAKDEALYLLVPDAFRKLNVSSVTIKQYQAEADNSTPLKGKWDDSPAYTSAQFYSLDSKLTDRWRYNAAKSKHNIPKGGLFADLLAPAEASAVSQYGWNATLGVSDESAVSSNLKTGVIRLVGVGTDPATIQNIEVNFEE
ncbi:MAG: hypothetical protein ACOYL6_08575 [Bacteriovoracaceae bacterium]